MCIARQGLGRSHLIYVLRKRGVTTIEMLYLKGPEQYSNLANNAIYKLISESDGLGKVSSGKHIGVVIEDARH